MADEAQVPHPPSGGGIRGAFKWAAGGLVGLLSGVGAMYGNAIIDKVAKPTKPLANFAVTADGMTVTCQNKATGDSGWWDFGDGTPLEPFAADQPTIPHTYTKPGSYSVKLMVRNFLNDENERTVPVDLSNPPSTLPLSITGLTVEPIGPRSVAPATFRVRGEVKNAERVILDLGEKVEVNTEAGPFERLVVFEKPGQFPIQVIGHTGKTAVKQSTTVNVSAAATGSMSIVVRVIDSATRTIRHDSTETVTLSPPKTGKTAERVVTARVGFTMTEATLGKPTGAAVQNLKVEFATDKKSAKVIGDPVGPGDSIIPVILKCEKSTVETFPPATSAATLSSTVAGPRAFGLTSEGTVPMPPQPLGITGLTRRMNLEIQESQDNGVGAIIFSVADVKLPWTGTFTRGTNRYPLKAEMVGDAVKVSVGAKQ